MFKYIRVFLYVGRRFFRVNNIFFNLVPSNGFAFEREHTLKDDYFNAYVKTSLYNIYNDLRFYRVYGGYAYLLIK